MRNMRFTSTRLEDKGKKGILKPDEAGYYPLVIGGLNAYNSAGEYYTLQGAIELFQSSSPLMRRLKGGTLYAELGHPSRQPNQSDDSFLGRVLYIDERNTSAHIRDIWLDHEFGKKYPEYQNPGLVAIMGWVKPAGPHAAQLADALANPHQNPAFSIRGLTDDRRANGRLERTLVTIITFDQVNEPGIRAANKWDAPALESRSDMPVKRSQLERVVKDESLVAMESSRQIAREALVATDPVKEVKKPLYVKW